MEEMKRIVLLGKTGSGKSSLGNTILDKETFEVNFTSISGTKSCTGLKNTEIQVIDTPGLFDTDPESSDLSPELLRCIRECAPGPHAFLLVLKVDKFTKQEQAVVDLFLNYFSEEALKYTTVVFTHGDQLKEGVRIKEWAIENEALSTLIQKCGGRCHVFDNKYWNNSQDSYRNNQHQVRELLKTIDESVQKNGGRCYTNEFLTMIHNEKQEMKNISTLSNLENEGGCYINEMLEEVAANKRVLFTLAGVSAGILLGALLGIPCMVLGALNAKLLLLLGIKVSLATFAAVGGAVGGVVGGAVGGAVGGYIGYKAAEEAPKTAKEAAEAVWQEAKDLLSKMKVSDNKHHKLD